MVKRRKKPDKLNVQLALRIGVPPGTKIKKRVLQEIIDRIIAGEELPRNVEVRALAWQNPDRYGNLSDWRYHAGADLTAVPSPRESSPRGTLQDAISTLAPFLETGGVTF